MLRKQQQGSAPGSRFSTQNVISMRHPHIHMRRKAVRRVLDKLVQEQRDVETIILVLPRVRIEIGKTQSAVAHIAATQNL